MSEGTTPLCLLTVKLAAGKAGQSSATASTKVFFSFLSFVIICVYPFLSAGTVVPDHRAGGGELFAPCLVSVLTFFLVTPCFLISIFLSNPYSGSGAENGNLIRIS